MTTAGALSIVADHFAQTAASTLAFFDAESGRIAECCRRMAERFEAGGTLLVLGQSAQASDAQHVAVEFVHPVLVGKRALPAVSLSSDPGVIGTQPGPCDDVVATRVRTLARRADLVLGLCGDQVSSTIRAALASARAEGLFTVLIAGRSVDVSVRTMADVVFEIEADNPLVVQEVSETLYHVLWELVHVFFDPGARQVVSFLPASPAAAQEADLVAQVEASTLAKAREVCEVRERLQLSSGSRIVDAGRALAAGVRRGGRLLACGNGGSATDAQDAVADCALPPRPGWRVIPALALVNDAAVVTAIGNDVGFDHVFSRQVIAFGRAGDVALGFSTSGASRNVLAALDEARARGLATIALSGADGGELARSPAVDICLTVPTSYIPRIQEAQATAWHALLTVAQEELA